MANFQSTVTEVPTPITKQRRFEWEVGTDTLPKIEPSRPPYQQAQTKLLGRIDILKRLSALEEKVLKIEKSHLGFIKINVLPNKKLRESLDAVVETDDEGFIARTTDIPLYGYGDDPIEAIDNLKCEIETLFDDLMEHDQFADEWLEIKKFLRGRITEK